MHSPQPAAAHPTVGSIVLLGALSAVGALAIDIYLPSLPAIGRALHASPAAVANTVATYLIGMAAGQLLWGPLSDRMGRRPVLLIGFGIAVVASLFCAAAPNIAWLTAGRFLQALGSCTGMVVGRAVVRDRYSHQDSARIFSFIMLVFGVVPLVAPLIGATLIAYAPWRMIFIVLAAFAAAVWAAVFFRLDESRSAMTAAQAQNESIVMSFVDLLRQRRLVGYLLAAALNGATLFTYIAAGPDLFISTFGFTPTQFAWLFGLNAIGIVGASQVNRLLLDRFESDTILGASSLACVAAGASLCAAAAFGLGAPVIVALLFATLTAYGFVQSNASAGALSVDPSRAGATSALMGASAFGVGALAAAISGTLHDGTAVPMAAVMAVSLAGATAALFGLALPRRGEASDA